MGDGTEDEAEDALFAALSVKAGHFVLSDKLKQVVVPYLYNELGMLTLSDVERQSRCQGFRGGTGHHAIVKDTP